MFHFVRFREEAQGQRAHRNTHTRHHTSFVDAFVGCRSISVPAFLSSRSYLAATIAIYKISPLFASFIPLAQGSNGGIWRAKPTLRLHLSSHGALVFGAVRPVLRCCSYRDAPIFDCTSRTNREWRCLGKNERVRRHKVDEQFRTGLVGTEAKQHFRSCSLRGRGRLLSILEEEKKTLGALLMQAKPLITAIRAANMINKIRATTVSIGGEGTREILLDIKQ